MPISSVLRASDGRNISYDDAVVVNGSSFARIAVGDLFNIPVRGYSTAFVTYFGSYSGHATVTEAYMEGDGWQTQQVYPVNTLSSTNANAKNNAGTTVAIPVSGALRLRVRITIAPTSGQMCAAVTLSPTLSVLRVDGQGAHDNAINGRPFRIGGRVSTSNFTAIASGRTSDLVCLPNGVLVTYPYAIPEQTWNYAAASGGIANTTAVTIKAAAASGIRNYLRSLQVINSAAVASEFSVRDGSAGTVLYRGYVPASMTAQQQINFEPPLRGTAATLMEVAMTTTATATMFNAQGWTGP